MPDDEGTAQGGAPVGPARRGRGLPPGIAQHRAGDALLRRRARPAALRGSGRGGDPGAVGDRGARRTSRRGVGAPRPVVGVERGARQGPLAQAEVAAVGHDPVGAGHERPAERAAPLGLRADHRPPPVGAQQATTQTRLVGRAGAAAQGGTGAGVEPGPVDGLGPGHHPGVAGTGAVTHGVVRDDRVDGRLARGRSAVPVRRPLRGPEEHAVAEHAVAGHAEGVARPPPGDAGAATVGHDPDVGRHGRRSGVDRNDVVEVDELVGVAAHAGADRREVEAVVAVGVHLRDQDGAAVVHVLDVGDVAALVPADGADGRGLVGLAADALGDLAPLRRVAPVAAGVPVGEREAVARGQPERHPRRALPLEEAAVVADAAAAQGGLVAVAGGGVRVAVGAVGGVRAGDADPHVLALWVLGRCRSACRSAAPAGTAGSAAPGLDLSGPVRRPARRRRRRGRVT